MTRSCNLMSRALIVVWGVVGTVVVMADDSRYSLANRSPEIVISSEEMQAWVICYQDFLTIDDLSAEQKGLEHYDLDFYDDDEYWIIYFVPKLLDEKKHPRINRMTFGRGTSYWVHKDTMQIVKRLFDA